MPGMTLKWMQRSGGKTSFWNSLQKSLKKGSIWRDPCKVEGRTEGGNYLLIGIQESHEAYGTAGKVLLFVIFK